MRNVQIQLLDSDLRAAGIPITGIGLGVREIHETETCATFVPFDGSYIRLDWSREPKSSERQGAIKIIMEHSAFGQEIKLESLIDRGTNYPPLAKTTDATPSEEMFPWPPKQLDEGKLIEVVENGSIQQIIDALKAEPSLAFFDGGNLHSAPLGGNRVELSDLATWLRKADTRQAVKDLQRFIESPGTPSVEVLAFAGVEVPSAIDLGNGFRILPWNDMPSCFAKDQIDSVEPYARRPGQFIFKPTAAVIRESFYCPKMSFPIGKIFPRGKDANIVDCTTFFARGPDLHRILDCLTICGPCAPQAILSYRFVPKWVPLGMPAGGGYCEYLPEILTFRGYSHSELSIPELVDISQRYLRLKSSTLDTLRIPIERLNLAMHRNRTVDKALELGIAFESLIMDGEEGEITHKMSQRVAWLLGGNVDERLRIAKCVQDLYKLRSKAIHEGQISAKKKDLKTKQHVEYLLDETIEICARAIKRIIVLGAFPDWEKVLLGGKLDGTPE